MCETVSSSKYESSLPEALKRNTKKHKFRENKKHYGESISNRPETAGLRIEEGHWEGDTVVGKRAGKEAVVFSLPEKKTETHLAFRIQEKTSEAVMEVMRTLHSGYGDRFAEVFKTITVDNGSEFADFAQVTAWGVLRSTPLTHTPLGSDHRTSDTMACSVPSYLREHPLNDGGLI